jgi:hypothetical protein
MDLEEGANPCELRITAHANHDALGRDLLGAGDSPHEARTRRCARLEAERVRAAE